MFLHKLGNIVEYVELGNQRCSQCRHILGFDLNVGFYAKSVVNRSAVGGLEGSLQRIGHLRCASVLVAVTVVQRLNAASAGDVVFRHRHLHLAVVHQRQDVLYQAFAKRTRPDNHCAVQVLKAAGRNLGSRCTIAVDQHRHRHLGVFGVHSRVTLCVFGRYLAFGFHYQLALGQENVHQIDSLVHQSAAVVAQVEDEALHLGVLAFEAHESLADILGSILRVLVQLHVADVARQHPAVGHVWQLDFGASDCLLKRLAVAFQLECQFSTSLATHSRADVGIVLALGRFAIDSQDAVAGTQTSLVGRQVFVRL